MMDGLVDPLEVFNAPHHRKHINIVAVSIIYLRIYRGVAWP